MSDDPIFTDVDMVRMSHDSFNMLMDALSEREVLCQRLSAAEARLAEATEIIRESRCDVAAIAGMQTKKHRIASYAEDLARIDAWLSEREDV